MAPELDSATTVSGDSHTEDNVETNGGRSIGDGAITAGVSPGNEPSEAGDFMLDAGFKGAHMRITRQATGNLGLNDDTYDRKSSRVSQQP